MATFSALMTMTKSPPSTLGVNVGLCLPRSSLAASTASRPSTTSGASMTYHERVVSPAFGVYVGTASTFFSGWIPVTRVPVRRFAVRVVLGDRRRPEARLAYRTPTRQLTCGRPRRSKRLRCGLAHDVQDEVRVRLVGHIRRYLDGAGAVCVLVNPRAADDRHRCRIAAAEQPGSVGDALDDDLAAGEVESAVTGLFAGLLVATKRGATAAGRSQEHAAGAVEQIAGED